MHPSRPGLRARLLNSQSEWRRLLVFALTWSIWIAGCACWHFLGLGWSIKDNLPAITAFYATGAFLGGYCSLSLCLACAESASPTTRFSAMFVALAVLTIGFTLLLFVLQHRLYFSQWHEDFGTVTWLFQLFFTGLGSIFLFALTGMRALLPWGLAGLFFVSYCFSRGWFVRPR